MEGPSADHLSRESRGGGQRRQAARTGGTWRGQSVPTVSVPPKPLHQGLRGPPLLPALQIIIYLRGVERSGPGHRRPSRKACPLCAPPKRQAQGLDPRQGLKTACPRPPRPLRSRRALSGVTTRPHALLLTRARTSLPPTHFVGPRAPSQAPHRQAARHGPQGRQGARQEDGEEGGGEAWEAQGPEQGELGGGRVRGRGI